MLSTSGAGWWKLGTMWQQRRPAAPRIPQHQYLAAAGAAPLLSWCCPGTITSGYIFSSGRRCGIRICIDPTIEAPPGGVAATGSEIEYRINFKNPSGELLAKDVAVATMGLAAADRIEPIRIIISGMEALAGISEGRGAIQSSNECRGCWSAEGKIEFVFHHQSRLQRWTSPVIHQADHTTSHELVARCRLNTRSLPVSSLNRIGLKNQYF